MRTPHTGVMRHTGGGPATNFRLRVLAPRGCGSKHASEKRCTQRHTCCDLSSLGSPARVCRTAAPRPAVGIAAALDLRAVAVRARADVNLHDVQHRRVRAVLGEQPLHREASGPVAGNGLRSSSRSVRPLRRLGSHAIERVEERLSTGVAFWGDQLSNFDLRELPN